MIEKETIRLINDGINIEFAERNETLKDGIQKIVEDENEKGMLRSGRTYRRIAELCANEIKVRANLAWLTLHRIITTAGISFSGQLASEIQVHISTYLSANLNEIKEIMNKSASSASKDMIPSLLEIIDDSYDLSLRKVNNEIEIFSMSLNSQEMSQENSDNLTLNVYSPVGSIQIGNYTAATVTQSINQDDKEELIKALNIVEKAISSIEKISTFSKEEVLDLVKDSKSELSKENPNKTKLRGFISTIGQSLQSVATLHSAYQALKSVALILEINLP